MFPYQIQKEITVENKEYNEEEIMEMVKILPDCNRFPFPDFFMKKYALQKPEIQSFSDSIRRSAINIFSFPASEVREPAPGGIRTFPIREENETPQITVVPQSQEETQSSD